MERAPRPLPLTLILIWSDEQVPRVPHPCFFFAQEWDLRESSL